jgi:hypothetical protein
MWEVFPHLPPATYPLRHTTYRPPHLPSAAYLLSFQQHSRFQRVTIFVFYNIPALSRPGKSRSFVFIDIPASVAHF